MSFGPAPQSPLSFRRAAGLAAVVAAALAAGVVDRAAAQDPPAGPDAPDDRPPLPPEARPPVAAAVRFPDPDRRIFTGIRDFAPVASEKQNPDESMAWTEAVLVARRFPAADLERYAPRDLTPDDLTRTVSPRGGSPFRLELVRFDGRLTKVRKVEPTRPLAEAGVAAVYEGWLVPAGASPANPVCVVFTDPPAGLDLGPQADRWATFAGYFFKVMTYPGPDADPAAPDGPGWKAAPVLVGRALTALPGPPAAPPGVGLDKNLRILRLIRDDTRSAREEDNWEEYAAWNRVVLHARKFTADELEKAARKDLGFADLFEDGRRDYRLDPVYLEGRLIRLRKLEPNKPLREAGVEAAYEAWVVPKDQLRGQGHPVAVVVTDLPPGLDPQPADKPMNRWVGVAGYSFKLLRYESAEKRKDDPTRNVTKRAPLLIGRALTLPPDPDAPGTAGWTTTFVPAVTAGLLALIGTALALGWWFRRGDRKAKREIDAVRGRNPFGPEEA